MSSWSTRLPCATLTVQGNLELQTMNTMNKQPAKELLNFIDNSPLATQCGLCTVPEKVQEFRIIII